ncbi:MAG: glycosyltransferase family 2 protein [Chloroflexaceae bacterium]|nr:glycosyltransferase family 2 protein [Chloroflexaceae bacterium]
MTRIQTPPISTSTVVERTYRPTIGVVVISKNEEREMPSFLAHLLPWVDEIIIVDDTSTDGTQALARAAGAKVRVIEQALHPTYGFAGQRNRGIAAATADWLLHMDMDERVPPDLIMEIQQAICNPARDAYRYRRLNFFLHRPMRGGGWQTWNKPQLARRGMHQFEHAVHEECIIQTTPDRIGQLQHQMWHLNDENYNERMRKSFQYSQAEADKLLTRRQVRWYHLLAFPFWQFARLYVGKAGFRDGTPGLLAALHSACASFRAHALVWDQQNALPRPQPPILNKRVARSQ